MIKPEQMEKLKANWGEKAEGMTCLAEVRLYDPLSDWQCYIYAINPQNIDEIMCLISCGKGLTPITTEWRLAELYLLYNNHGEGIEVDNEYRPRRVSDLFKKLNELRIYEPTRD